MPGTTARDRSYWHDVGTLDAYYDAHMDLTAVEPIFNLYNQEWPIHTWPDPLPPAKFVFNDEGAPRVRGRLADLRRSGDLRRSDAPLDPLSGCTCTPMRRSRTRSSCEGRTSAGARRVRRAILDKNVRVAPGAQIGVDPEADRERFTVSANGVVVIAKGGRVEA